MYNISVDDIMLILIGLQWMDGAIAGVIWKRRICIAAMVEAVVGPASEAEATHRR